MVTDFDTRMMNTAIKYSCFIYNTSEDELISATRVRQMTDARAICLAILVSFTKMSLYAIGARFNRDHATAIAATKKVLALRDTNPEFRYKLNIIIEYVNVECGTQYTANDIVERKDVPEEGTQLYELFTLYEKKHVMLFGNWPDVFLIELIKELKSLRVQIDEQNKFLNNQ